MVVRGLLSKLSVVSQLCSSGEDALQYYRNHYSELDFVLMDCEMPGMDGYQCTRRIREFEAQHTVARIPIYALSAHAMREHEEKSIAAGMDGHLTKPIDVRNLEKVILSVQCQAS